MGKRGHGGHHGGSWKVAYADFVTSMMALFLVLWLVSSDAETRKAVQEYFRGELKRPGEDGVLKKSKVGPQMHKKLDVSPKDMIMLQELKRTVERLEQVLKNSQEVGDDFIRFEYLADGVRIVAIDRAKKPFFEPGTDVLTDFGKWVLQSIAWEIERYPFLVEVEGHTQRGGEGLPGTQSWNLSTLRAIKAKDQLSDSGIVTERFFRVAGYSDRLPLNEESPESDENRRISIVVRAGTEAKLYNISDAPKGMLIPK